MKNYTKLIRLEQWYKNLIIFAPLLFASNVYPIDKLIIGFFGFSCVSSITYIVNDWMDREQDRLHPIKKERPLASGKINGKQAIIVALLLSLVVLSAVYLLGLFYGSIILSYFILTNLYSLGLKNIPLLDIIIIGTNFALRMMAGIQNYPNINVLPYFTLLLAIITIFLTHKRSSDIKMLGKKAIKHKPVLKYYTPDKNYIYRSIGYIIVAISFFVLWQNGIAITKVFSLYLLLLITSVIFSNNPEYTSKPQWLLKSKLWCATLILSIIICLF